MLQSYPNSSQGNQEGHSPSDFHEDENAYWRWKQTGSEADAQLLNSALRRYAGFIVADFFHRRDPDLVVDIVTKTFLQEHKFSGRSKFTTWFHTLARRMCLNKYRATKRKRECALQDVPAPLAFSMDSSNYALLLEGLMKGLTPLQKTLLQARVDGTPSQELAQQLGWTPQKLSKTWRKLQQLLQKRLVLERPKSSKE